jgi:hypothetical protein
MQTITFVCFHLVAHESLHFIYQAMSELTGSHSYAHVRRLLGPFPSSRRGFDPGEYVDL